MNTENVISADAAGDLTGKEYFVVKLSSTGVDLAASGDVILGSLLRAQPHQEDGVYAGKSVGVQLWPGSIHYAVIGASTASVAKGASLAVDPANPGKLIPAGANPVIAEAFDAFTAANGAVVRVIFTALAGGLGASTALAIPQSGVSAISTADGSDAATTQALANATKSAFNTLRTKLIAAGILS